VCVHRIRRRQFIALDGLVTSTELIRMLLIKRSVVRDKSFRNFYIHQNLVMAFTSQKTRMMEYQPCIDGTKFRRKTFNRYDAMNDRTVNKTAIGLPLLRLYIARSCSIKNLSTIKQCYRTDFTQKYKTRIIHSTQQGSVPTKNS